jgi:hypothetical protein
MSGRVASDGRDLSPGGVLLVRILSVAVVFGLVAGPAWGQGDKAYTIKIKKLGKGQSERVEKAEQSTQAVKVMDNNGNLIEEKEEKKARDFVYVETVLEQKGSQKATKLTRKYEKAVETKEGKDTTLPFQGKTVLIEKKGDKYEFRVEGGEELTGEAAEALNKEFNKKGQLDDATLVKLLLPDRAVKVGESWQIDSKVIEKAFGEGAELELAPGKTAATGKLVRAYKKGGRQYGVITLHLRLMPKSVSQKGNKIPLQPNSQMTLEMTVDTCIDGSSTNHTATFRGDAAIEALLPNPDNPMARLALTIRGKGNSKSVEQ